LARPKPLVVIPVFLGEPQDLATTVAAISSVRATQGDAVDIMCIDDFSPGRELVDGLEAEIPELAFDLHRKEENTGFSKTVNVGLRRALNEGRDAILMNADVEIQTPGWLRRFKSTTDHSGKPAGVAGALLLFPNGLIQHGGIYFSLITRTFDHMFKYGPGNLPEALHKIECPVTGALQYIRHPILEKVGIYDEKFSMGWEDVDYCIRVFLADEVCVYNPNVRAFHHEMMFRGRPSEKVRDWQQKSWVYLAMKYQEQSFAGLVPFW
jgi:GT2 family glycosyltransferase